MPYRDISDLPANIQKILPKHAQEIYTESFNNAFKQYQDPKKRSIGSSHEETVHRVAWAAVKKQYEKGPKGKWIKK